VSSDESPVPSRFAATAAVRREWYLEKPIVHRGLHNIFEGVVEHSRTAIKRAIDADLPIEIDIQNSIDDRSFVFHDFSLDKLTNGKGQVRDLTSETIRSYSLIHTQGEPIMTLEELLELVDGRVPLLIEFKNREIVIPDAIANAARILSKYKGRFSIHSFSPILMEWFRERYPSFTRGLITSDTDILEGRDHYLLCMLRNRIEPHYVAHEMSLLNCWTFQWAVEQDLPILAWTVRDQDDWENARTFADNIVFEFINPDKKDWRKPAEANWRAEVGERTDRKFCRNQPIRLKSDAYKGCLPWWARNRSWPPVPGGAPRNSHIEAGALYDPPSYFLSVFENKREIYKNEPQYRGAWLDWTQTFGQQAIPEIHKTALILLTPEAILSGRASRIVKRLMGKEFVPSQVFEIQLDRNTCYELARHVWINAARERIELELKMLMLCPLVGVFLEDQSTLTDVPAAVRLSGIVEAASVDRGASTERGGNLPDEGIRASEMLIADEPIDIIRMCGLLFDTPARRAQFLALGDRSASRRKPEVRALSKALGRRQGGVAPEQRVGPETVQQLDELISKRAGVQPTLPDRGAPFGHFSPGLAQRLWQARLWRS
jgi:glycerophosphoryl diester phosphodiesterase